MEVRSQRKEVMNRRKLIYHKNNIEEAQARVEQFIAHRNEDRCKLDIYAVLKALVLAVGYILDEMEREDSNGESGR